MESIKVHDKEFKKYIDHKNIAQEVDRIAKEIDAEYKEKKPLFIGILNGSFIFAADLIRAINIQADISFVKVTSYEGTNSGEMTELIGLKEDIKDRPVIIIEDIVDTGNTLNKLMPYLLEKEPKRIEIAALLCKPAAIQYPIEVSYICFEIPNDFVIGYGLDYNGLGRQYKDIYQTVD